VEEITLLKEFMPYEIKSVDISFKYLGCYLKPNCYTNADWIWIEKKVEKIIANWSHRWLSLGGRYTLIKSVL